MIKCMMSWFGLNQYWIEIQISNCPTSWDSHIRNRMSGHEVNGRAMCAFSLSLGNVSPTQALSTPTAFPYRLVSINLTTSRPAESAFPDLKLCLHTKQMALELSDLIQEEQPAQWEMTRPYRFTVQKTLSNNFYQNR